MLPKAQPTRCPAHLAWIRSRPCCIPGCRGQNIEAHHERRGSGGGTGIKPGDEWAIPLCHGHHREGHQIGWQTFDARHNVNLRSVAQALALASPPLTRRRPPPN